MLGGSVLGDLVFRLTAFLFKMPRIGNVANITDLIAQVHQVAVDDIKRNIGPGMSQVTFTANRRSAHIHTHMTWHKGYEFFFISYIGIVNFQLAHKSY
jgi:hypothetical protein